MYGDLSSLNERELAQSNVEGRGSYMNKYCVKLTEFIVSICLM